MHELIFLYLFDFGSKILQLSHQYWFLRFVLDKNGNNVKEKVLESKNKLSKREFYQEIILLESPFKLTKNHKKFFDF